ncbi:MAG: YybS family protein [Vicinamibacteria bacterium]|jgi:hypothetical protein|nr:YybS family protein [Vicinamibacteria bacterium]
MATPKGEAIVADSRPFMAIGAALCVVMLFSTLLLAPASGALTAASLLAVVAPFPLMVLRLRASFGGTAISALLAVALAAALFSPGWGAILAVFFIVPGLAMVESLVRGHGLLRGCLLAFSTLAVTTGALLLTAGSTWRAELLRALGAFSAPAFIEQLKTSGWTPEKIEAWIQNVRLAERLTADLYPAMTILMCAMVVIMNATLFRRYLLRRDPASQTHGALEEIRWPLGMAVVFVATVAAVFFAPLRTAAYNVLLLLGFAFLLQGVAVASFFARRLMLAPILRLMSLAVLIIFLPQVLALLGLFDIWADFRRWAGTSQGEAE